MHPIMISLFSKNQMEEINFGKIQKSLDLSHQDLSAQFIICIMIEVQKSTLLLQHG